MFELVPYSSIGPILFGMTEAEVIAALGEPARRTVNRRSELEYDYGAVTVVFSSSDRRIVEFSAVPGADVVVAGMHLFSADGAFERLLQLDDDPREFHGFVVLLKLGITLTGFHDRDESQKAVTAFEKGRWDHLLTQMKKLPR
jgi:hypothetical protein